MAIGNRTRLVGDHEGHRRLGHGGRELHPVAEHVAGARHQLVWRLARVVDEPPLGQQGVARQRDAASCGTEEVVIGSHRPDG